MAQAAHNWAGRARVAGRGEGGAPDYVGPIYQGEIWKYKDSEKTATAADNGHGKSANWWVLIFVGNFKIQNN